MEFEVGMEPEGCCSVPVGALDQVARDYANAGRRLIG
jgi:hypothetical protein